MFKIIGAVIVIVTAGFIGIRKYSELYERKKILCTIRDGAEKIRGNLSCMCMPLYECFLQGGEFFKKAAKTISEGELPATAVKMSADRMELTSEDIDCVYRFADGLCAMDCEGQIRNAELFIKELERQIEKASSELETKGKLFVKGSFLAAAAVVLILI